MKDYKEITESLFKRRDKYLEEQKKKKGQEESKNTGKVILKGQTGHFDIKI